MGIKYYIGIVIIIIVIGLGASILLQKINTYIEKDELNKGKISILQYCSKIGDAAVDDPQCKIFEKLPETSRE